MGMSRRGLLGGLSALLVLTGCNGSPGSAENSSTTNPLGAECAPDRLRTEKPGAFTIATYERAYAPWYVDNDPGNGQGFEAALGYRIAQQLGYRPADVEWSRQPFEQIVKSGTKSFDLALAQVSVTSLRRSAVDFTSPYESVSQVLITYPGSKISGQTSIAKLRSARLGASAATTSLSAISRTIRPTTTPVAFPSISDAQNALARHQVDGIVADLPTALYLVKSVLDDGEVVGQLPGSQEEIAGVLPHKSRLRTCVNRAIKALEDDGTVEDLTQRWLPQDRPAQLSP